MLSASHRKTRGTRVLASSLVGSELAIAAVSARAQDFSGSAAVTSDYVFRGIAQTRGDPALQLGGKVAGESGFYVAIWGRFVEISLRAQGDAVRTAANGQEGLAALASLGADVVILDLGLPDMDGHAVLRELRAWSQVPVIVLTVRDDEAEKVAALDAGATT